MKEKEGMDGDKKGRKGFLVNEKEGGKEGRKKGGRKDKKKKRPRTEKKRFTPPWSLSVRL